MGMLEAFPGIGAGAYSRPVYWPGAGVAARRRLAAKLMLDMEASPEPLHMCSLATPHKPGGADCILSHAPAGGRRVS